MRSRIEKINLNKIRGPWQENSALGSCGGDDTITSIRLVAEKVNEIIDSLTPSKE